jgi:hypothetical protein
MPRRPPQIRFNEIDPNRLPEMTSEGVALVMLLAERGVLDAIGQRIRIRRKSGGYSGLDVVIFLLYYFSSNASMGLATWYQRIAPYRKRLAALALRDDLPTASAMSRALDAVEVEQIRPAVPWLLSEAADIDVVLRHPCVQTYDTRGQGWHVFELDPTMTVLRHRALPVGEDLPAPVRRSAEMAAAGYPGRKRGEVQLCRAVLQHSGSSCWLSETLSPGNGDIHGQLEKALAVVVETCARLGHPLSRALLRMDGQYGWVPFYTACRERRVPFLTRLTRPELLAQPDVGTALQRGEWQLVPDSRSGPVRGALDLGLITVPAGQDTTKPDGSAYEPVTVRVVVSRFPSTSSEDDADKPRKKEKKRRKSRGVALEGWQYELFATDLPPDAFPAPEVVAGYFARAGFENRLSQEDREAGLDRIFSYHLPGQELAVAVGLWVWNLRVVQGFRLDPPPARPPEQASYSAVRDERAVCGHSAVSGAQGEEESEASAVSGTERDAAEAEGAGEALTRALGALDWGRMLARQRGWVWAEKLLCPQGRPLRLSTVRTVAGVFTRRALIFCRPAGGCRDCAQRIDCFRAKDPGAAKHKELYARDRDADAIEVLLRAQRAAPPPAQVAGEQACAKEQPPPVRAKAAFARTPLELVAGPLSVTNALFLPAKARGLWRKATADLSVRVTRHEAPPRPARPTLLAQDDAARQHRRWSWTQQLAAYALDPETRVHIELTGGAAIRHLLEPSPHRASA